MADEMLLALAAGQPVYELAPEKIDDLNDAIRSADRGEFASN
jgi:hypothetical protein